ncbi:MAG: type II/IV secretion system protein, partial [Candidatus Aminicenantes bacterium]|nr:type II/IV secretion system protein [Candidatus Aminicenantes bacterium]
MTNTKKTGEQVKNNPLTEELETKKVAERYKVPYLELSSLSLSRKLIQSFPVDFLHRALFIPLEDNRNSVKIAIADPSDIEIIDSIESYLGKKVEVFAASKTSILEALRKSETALQVLKDATAGFVMQVVDRESRDDEEVISVEKLADQDASIIKLVNSIIFTAVQKRASDIHVESWDDGVAIKYRIDGVLREAMEAIDKKFQSPIVSRIKVMSDLDIAERRVPQDGRFRLKIKEKTIDFRVSIMPSIYGEDAVIRILDKEMITEAISELKMELLGFSDALLKKFRKYIVQPYGMVLVTGPTGSGKTTTLYSILKHVDAPDKNIITVEDPVEYELFGINQVTIKPDIGLTFASSLRSILRQDPDVIMVGEIRDFDTVDIAIKAALTGHLVLSTLHTTDAVGSVIRLVNMGVEP